LATFVDLDIAWDFQLASFDAVRQVMNKVPFVQQVDRNTETIQQLEKVVPGLRREANGIVGSTKIVLQLSHLAEVKVEMAS
jgi:hypothetical protein